MKTEENGIWSDLAQEGLDKMQKKERRKKVFNRVVNPLLHKYFTDPNIEEHSIAKNIPMKYLKYFKEVTGSGNGMKVQYRFRGNSKSWYKRPQSFCHMHGADTFAVYGR